MASLQQLVTYCNELLQVNRFRDYCPNGLQVEGHGEVSRILAGVTASQALIDAAIFQKADAVLVHHGYFWRGEDPTLVGIKARRISSLLKSNISLLAYHLPLDAHPQFGNNVQLAKQLSIAIDGRFGPDENQLGLLGSLDRPMSGSDFVRHVHNCLGRAPLHISSQNRTINRLAWCTGGAQNYFESAIAQGVDVFITGEVSEQQYHLALESGVDFIAAGHHATERYGVQALAEHLAEKFSIRCDYFELANPV